MEFVHPIKSKEQINHLKSNLKQKSLRDYLLFVLEINTGMRINELLLLKVHHVWDGSKPREYITTECEKTLIQLNFSVHSAIEEYLSSAMLQEEDYLFRTKNNSAPISRQQAYRIINNAAHHIHLPYKIGMHTLRKTFGYHAYKQGISISIIRDIYGHASSSETIKYIDVEQSDSSKILLNVNL